MRISDWSSDVCSSDLDSEGTTPASPSASLPLTVTLLSPPALVVDEELDALVRLRVPLPPDKTSTDLLSLFDWLFAEPACDVRLRSEEHTSELQSLMRISYAVFCLKKKKKNLNKKSA